MDRFNRLLWAILATVFGVAGVLGAVASLGGMAGTDTDSPLLWSALLRRWRENADAAGWTMAAAGVLLAVLGALLIRAQLRRRGGPGLGDLTLEPDRGDPARCRGTTTVAAGALSGALQRDLAGISDVTRARVRLIGQPRDLHIRAGVHVRSEAELEDLGQAVQTCLNRFSLTSGLKPDSVAVTIALEETRPTRVR